MGILANGLGKLARVRPGLDLFECLLLQSHPAVWNQEPFHSR